MEKNYEIYMIFIMHLLKILVILLFAIPMPTFLLNAMHKGKNTFICNYAINCLIIYILNHYNNNDKKIDE